MNIDTEDGYVLMEASNEHGVPVPHALMSAGHQFLVLFGINKYFTKVFNYHYHILRRQIQEFWSSLRSQSSIQVMPQS